LSKKDLEPVQITGEESYKKETKNRQLKLKNIYKKKNY
jgi:hypothetical protein